MKMKSSELELELELLSLQLNKSETIPASPNRNGDGGGWMVDWLADYSGLSWVAYGASSLLVISHFPSPLSQQQTLIGPVHRQVIQLSNQDDQSSIVRALAWSPSLPSRGEIAVAIHNFICLCVDTSTNTHGSFYWLQVAVLLHSSPVDALVWTGSGDGIITAGVDVVLWQRNTTTWEMSWKFTPQYPQAMVSATWSTTGPLATASYATKFVLVSHMDQNSGLLHSQLTHPQPVSSIHWRPSNHSHSRRDVLLTCCLDGTVRLWSEIDRGRPKHTLQPFNVIAVIETSLSFNGTLGIDAYVTWDTHINCSSPTQDIPGKCDWLIGYAPHPSLTFWAIHCLDDISPLRFPRVTLWNKLDLGTAQGCYFYNTPHSNSAHPSLFIKAVISRTQLCGPPSTCFLFQMLSDNTMGWSQLYIKESHRTQRGLLSLDGHGGTILQVAIHPYGFEVELAVSLDSNGLLLFWCFSTISSCILGMPGLVLPAWKLVGKMVTQHLFHVEYSCLSWAPSVSNNCTVLLLGHSKGIDCFLIQTVESELDKIVYHKLGTIPFSGHNLGIGPTSISAIPLTSSCRKAFVSNRFTLLGVWMNEFQSLSWKVSLHSADFPGNICDCNFDVGVGVAGSHPWRYESSFAGKRYCLVAEPYSLTLSASCKHDKVKVTSIAVVSPGTGMPSLQQRWPSSNGLCSNSAPYQVATGYSDGNVSLWRSTSSKPSTPHPDLDRLSWELVGKFNVHQGPITAISLSSSGGKIATVNMENCLDNFSTLCIWQSVCIITSGCFLLEDKISLKGVVVALNWFSIGNGQLLLGVCMENELRVYAQRNIGSQTHLKSDDVLGTHIWFCIAIGSTSVAARDFIWGPGATPVLVHERHFCLFSNLSFDMDTKHQAMLDLRCSEDNNPNSNGGVEKEASCAVFTYCNVCDVNDLSMVGISRKCKTEPPSKLNTKIDYPVCNISSTAVQQEFDSGAKQGPRTILEVAGELRGSLPFYHPDALLLDLYSGNWRRACAAVRHLVRELTSNNSSAACNLEYDCTKPNNIIPQPFFPKCFEEASSPWVRDADPVSSAELFHINSKSSFGHIDADADGSNNSFNSGSGKPEMAGFIETVEKLGNITAITSNERIQLLAVMDILGQISDLGCASTYESLDEPARRFWVAVKFQRSHFHRRFGGSAVMNELVVDSGMIGWAVQSDCQDNLLNSFLSSEPSWPEMRNSGLGFWLTDAASLRTRMEKLARSQYLKNKDPKDCALLYIALDRVKVLAGLFKLSKDDKDKPLVGFLSRNFQDEKNKAAALKNAYVLMGRHQLELAIAFFLLGGDASSAVSVCVKTLGDEQLALVICRLLEGFGGPLEHHLISKFLLPAAVERGDCWLASLLEWTLGNYVQSFLRLLGFNTDMLINNLALAANQAAFLDPQVGQYCLVLAKKNFMKNCIGESAAMVLARWAVLMTSTAYNRCGFPIEALRCLSSSSSSIEGKHEGGFVDLEHHGIPHGLLGQSNDASTWLSGDVALHIESNHKLDLALHYISNSIMEHPYWTDTILSSLKPLACNEEYRCSQFRLSVETFQHKLNAGLATFIQDYSLNSVDLLNMIFVYLYNNGIPFLGYHIIDGYLSQGFPPVENHTFDSIFQYPPLPQLFLKATEEVSLFFARYLVCCSTVYTPPNLSIPVPGVLGTDQFRKLHAVDVYTKRSIHFLENFGATLEMYQSSFLTEDLIVEIRMVVNLLECYIAFTAAWLQKNLKGLILTIHPILITYDDGRTPSHVDVLNLKKHVLQNLEVMFHDSYSDVVTVSKGKLQPNGSGDLLDSVPEDERWQLLGALLWRHLFKFNRNLLKSFPESLSKFSSSSPLGRIHSLIYITGTSESDAKYTMEALKEVPGLFAKLVDNTLTCIASVHTKQLASVLSFKLEKRFPVPSLVWLEKYIRSHPKPSYNKLKMDINSLQLVSNENEASLLRVLWEMVTDPREIEEVFTEENMSWLLSSREKFSKGWTDVHKGSQIVHENDSNSNAAQECSSSSSVDGESGTPAERRSENGGVFLKSRKKHVITVKEDSYFETPREIYKRNGELLEAMCVNSINQQEVAVSSNRKGILFFKWKDEQLCSEHSEYIWSEADWPQNGWAGSESAPIPTYVSPGIDLGSKKGAHLVLGATTIGLGSLARPESDLMGGRAFGVPAYGGVGASGVDWGTQDDFEFVDPPATVDNISTRALSSHPSRPFFLVGSSNTHTYLWEFGMEKATATYGVLPASTIPPPYALASISALQFDHCGHRFVTAALDGTICTWQLEVGGRSNIHPTESSLCFNRHALDVTYVAASGSVIAAAGYSSDDVNVVIWDTLAPSTTSQASLICHEGGARSVSVFDNNLGSGSVSPLIVTGGKGGDVGLHDFRFIATGKSKRYRHSSSTEQSDKYSHMHEARSGVSTKSGEQNSKGMLWYIPKAHLGSVTKIATIPDTSFFLTGGKDGDVKLWDAKKAELVFHWPKLHDRHTFLQPSSRGFGGIVRAAVTDIQVVSEGFLTCGGDGSVKVVQFKGFPCT